MLVESRDGVLLVVEPDPDPPPMGPIEEIAVLRMPEEAALGERVEVPVSDEPREPPLPPSGHL